MTNVISNKHLQIQLTAVEKRLYSKEVQLNAMLEITNAINSNFNQSDLYALYEDTLVNKLGIDRLALFIAGDMLVCLGHYNVSPDVILTISKDGLHAEHITRLRGDKHSFLQQHFDYIVPVYHKKHPLAYVLFSGLQTYTDDELEAQVNFVQVLTNIVAIAIENKRLAKQHTNQEVIRKELELAGQMQTRLIAHTLPYTEVLMMAGLYLPNFDVGGDYYDYIPVTDEDVIFCIADISGQGVQAAMLMASFRATIRTMLADNIHPYAFIKRLNARVCDITEGDKFITAFIAHYNTRTRKLTYVNAGHTPPVLVSPTGTEYLNKGCTILGMFDSLPYVHTGRVRIQPGSTMLCYTDGLTELENEKGVMYDVPRLTKFMETHKQQLPKTCISSLLQDIIDFKGKNVFKDDISMLCVRFG